MTGLESETLEFASSEPLTLGVEVEIQLLDKNTLDLTPMSPVILERMSSEKIKAEIFQSMIEVNTGICKDAHEVRADLSASIDELTTVCNSLGIRLASAGTHPFASYAERILYPAKRYTTLIDRNQWIARRLMIFGLHIHIGMRNGEHAIQMNNALLHYLPILLALSASSPYWNGEDTELASSRITFFEALPTGGHPCKVTSWDQFLTLYGQLVRSGAIRSPKDIWWDIRPSPSFGTLEIRICDGAPTVAETVAITALAHSLSIFIDQQLTEGRLFAPPPDWLMRENKWRASRWGTKADLIINEQGDSLSLIQVVKDLLVELKPIMLSLQYQKEFELIEKLLDQGVSSQRQRSMAEHVGNDFKKVTSFLVSEFEQREPIWQELV